VHRHSEQTRAKVKRGESRGECAYLARSAKHCLRKIEVFEVELEIDAAAKFFREALQGGNGVKIAAFVQKQRGFFLRRVVYRGERVFSKPSYGCICCAGYLGLACPLFLA
jgi:hypothetical protein